jgi:hypothetical protein
MVGSKTRTALKRCLSSPVVFEFVRNMYTFFGRDRFPKSVRNIYTYIGQTTLPHRGPSLDLRPSILDRIKRDKSIRVWTPNDLLDLGARSAIDKALQRLVMAGSIRRIDRGLYDVPRANSLTGKTEQPRLHRDHRRCRAAGGSSISSGWNHRGQPTGPYRRSTGKSHSSHRRPAAPDSPR